MLQGFIKFLGGEPGEERRIWFLLGLGFFMGVFLATYQVGAETLFIKDLGEAYLDVAFFVTGGLGIISTVLFVFLQRRIKYSTLVISNAFLTFLFIAGSRAAFEYLPADLFNGFGYLQFTMFVMMGPITAITLLGFWGMFGRIFDTRQSKRIIGGIDTGQLTATIIAFFSIPLITRFFPFIDEIYDLLFVSGVACFGILIFTIFICITWNVDKATQVQEGEDVERVGYGRIIADPYTRLLSLFLIFSVGAATFIAFTFYSVSEILYTDPETSILDEQKLGDFLSFFNGTVMIMSFLIQSFVNDIIIGRFGLKVALMTMPVILILFTIGALVSGHMYGYEEANKEFLLFFMFVVSGMAFSASLRDALESPAFKLFFLPFNIKIRFDIQTRIEGVINEFATLLAGALQMAFAAFLVWFELIHYAYFIIALAIMVIILANQLYNQYKVTLKSTLQKQKEALEESGKRNEHNTLNVLKHEFREDDEKRVRVGLRILERLDPIEFQFELLNQLQSDKPEIRGYAYSKLADYQCFDALGIIEKELKSERDASVQKIGELAVKQLQTLAEYELDDVSIRKYVRSTEAEDRIIGAALLTKLTEDRHVAYVVELLRDINPDVRTAAMITAGKLKRPEVWNILIENMHNPVFGNVTMSGLAHSGEAAFYNVDSAFYKTGQHHSTMMRVVQILGRVGGRQATEYLWKKIDYPNKQILTELLLSLSYIGFVGKDFQGARIKLVVESLIGDIAWNIKAIQDIPNEYPVDPVDRMLRKAMMEENQVNYNNIFMLLGMIYDPQSVLLVKENVAIGSTESITFAVELMDVFLEDELKPKLFPVVDELKDEERLKRLIHFFPPEEFESYKDLLLQIVNRNYNRITRYTKAIALYRYHQLKRAEVNNTLIANLFNPDPLLLETAAYALYKLDEEAYMTNTRRLKPAVKKSLDHAILPPVYIAEGEEYHKKLLLVERILRLKQIDEFDSIPGELITYISDAMDEIRIQEGQVLIQEGAPGTTPMYVILEGSIELHWDDDRKPELVRKNKLVGEKLLLPSEEFDFNAIAKEKTTLLVMKKEDLLDLMSKHIEIMEAFIGIMNEKPVEEILGAEEVAMSIFN